MRVAVAKFTPSKEELRKLRKLFRELKTVSVARDAKALTWNQYFERDKELRGEVQSLANEVGLRTIGELPLTLREADWSEASPRKPVVVYEYQVHEWAGRLEWEGWGVELRKDGSVGEVTGAMALDRWPLARRHLNGTWAPLVLPVKC